MAYDTKCYDLAEMFLGEIAGATTTDFEALAQDIQNVIEDHCNALEEANEDDLDPAELQAGPEPETEE